MSDQPNRVSQTNLAAVIASAVAIEQQRIEQIDGALVDAVVGGASDDKTGTTMGYFPPSQSPNVD